MINFERLNVNTNGRTSGRMKTHCPQCHDTRHDKRDKSLSINLDTGMFYCHYCEWKGCAKSDPKSYGNSAAERHGETADIRRQVVLSDEIVRWFSEQRGIPANILIDAGITSAEEYMPQTRKKELCACFNYYEGKRLVNTKFRDLSKNFKLVAGAELIPYNLNGILGTEECIITEGEIDALSIMTIGRTDVISVPGGANSNLSWMDRFVASHFDDKRTIYICVDTDRKGQELRNELIRRLGAERCRIVDLTPSKDANQLLLEPHGREALKAAIENAPQAPLEGVYTAEDLNDELRTLFENGLGYGADTGWANLDRICTFEHGRICVVTGIPGSGKSEFVDELVLRLCLRHHWRAAYFSPENQPMVYHLQKLSEKLAGVRFNKHAMPEGTYHAIVRYLQENITSILPKDDFTTDNILAKARELVHRRGIRQFILDPLNCIDHLIPRDETETQYMNRFLNKLINFARRNHCLVILVAHPRKMNREPGTNRTAVPDMYDISGSAAFFNKCDYGIVVERNREAQVTRIHVEKVKFKHLGDKGIASFTYNRTNGRFTECGEKPGLSGNITFTPLPFDNSCWLSEKPEEPTLF
jgi:twinkle protein